MNQKNEIMTINLAKGHFNVVSGHDVLKVDFNDLVLPCQRYRFDIKQHEAGTPDISTVYETCLKAKMSQEEIIDTLIHLFFPLRFFRVGDYERMAIVMGFIGMRGSGKTASAVIVASCDFLLRNMPVWSNVPINIRVVYRDAQKTFSSRDLDEMNMLDLTEDYGGGCVLYDEVNMEAAESTRYASAANLKFSYAMQQIRKRLLSLIWTCQGWSWIDNRLRWQTDFCIACRDASFENKRGQNGAVGDASIWRIHDLSGTSGKFSYDFELKHRYLTDYMIGMNKVWIRPWWNSYNTGMLQGQSDYVKDYKVSVEQKNREEKSLLSVVPGQLPKQTVTLEKAVDMLLEVFHDRDAIYCNDAWQYLSISDKSIQTRIGQVIISKGYQHLRDSKKRYYWKKEAINDRITTGS